MVEVFGFVGIVFVSWLIYQFMIGVWHTAIAGLRGSIGLIVLPALMLVVAFMFFHRRKVNYDTSESWDAVYTSLVITLKLALFILAIMVFAAFVSLANSGEYVLCFQDPSTPGREVVMKDEFGKAFCMKDYRG